jgi:hypothetical protein
MVTRTRRARDRALQARGRSRRAVVPLAAGLRRLVVALICLVEIRARLRAFAAAAFTVASEENASPRQPRERGQAPEQYQELAAQDDADGEHHGVRESSGERRPPISDRQDALWAQSPTSGRENAAPAALAVPRLGRRPGRTSAQVVARLGVHPLTVRPQFNARDHRRRSQYSCGSMAASITPPCTTNPVLGSSIAARGAAALAHNVDEEDVYEECGEHNI